MQSLKVIFLITATISVFATRSEAAPDALIMPDNVQGLIKRHFADCHEGESAEGKVRFDTIEELSLDTRLDLLNKAQEQVFFRLMPPADEEQPADAERVQLIDWISGELRKHDASLLDEKLKRPEYGNYVDHEKLFSGECMELPGYSNDRRWLISEFIFDAKINRLLDHQGIRMIDGQKRTVIGDNGVGLGTQFGGQSLRQGVTNPFLLPDQINVRYFSNDALTSGHLLTMISNARKIAAYMVSESTMKAHYPAMHNIMRPELEHRETLRTRDRFLSDHIGRLLAEIYQDEHAALLPVFVRREVKDPPQNTNKDGTPRLETNLGLLERYDDQDLRAIYLGIGQYNKEGIAWDQVIEQCERDWFFYGIHEKRIESRISIMKVLHTNWDMPPILADVQKKNIQPPTYAPLSDSEMAIIRQSIQTQRKPGDRFQQIIDRCLAEWEAAFRRECEATGQTDDTMLGELVVELYDQVFERKPTVQEVHDSNALFRSCMMRLSTQESISKLVESLLLSSELVYRSEFGTGEPDKHGRRMMSPRDASYALAYALTDSSPDADLVNAVDEGHLKTREDYRREVIRILGKRDQYYVIDETVQKGSFNASITNTPIRKLRFFREFFGYPHAMLVFKDDSRFGAGQHESAVSRLIDEADMLVDHILRKDQHVIEELLTTEKFYVYHSGDNAAMQAASERLRTIYDYFKDYDWENFTEEQLYEHWPFIKKMQMRGTVFPDFETSAQRRSGWVRSFKTTMASLEYRFSKGQKNATPFDELPMAYWHKGNATGRTGQVMRGHQVSTYFNIDYRDWDYPTTQPARVQNRKGLLTHPAWLIAHSLNTETDPVRRGKWVREKLLAGTIPDVPITVDAVIPEDHHKTLRQRLENRTGATYCWKCHQKMDPLGLPFEIFDDFGRYRTEERLEHEENLITAEKQAPLVGGVRLPIYKTLPVDAHGVLDGTGDSSLDGEVQDAFDLADRLANSERVRQSIIRHAFRYFLGRNETLSDSKTLIDADRAYVESDGSFDAVIVSLLTSDSFIYRKPVENQQ